MATGKHPLLLRANSACKEHLGTSPTNSSPSSSKGSSPKTMIKPDDLRLKGVDISRLWRTLEAGKWTFCTISASDDRGLHLKHCHGNWQAPSASQSELCSQGTLGQHHQTTVRSLAAKTLPAR